MRGILSLLVLFVLLYSDQAIADNIKPAAITATSWLVTDGAGKVIDGVNEDQQRSIASITKLMTAIVVLDAHQDLDERIGTFTRQDLIQLMLIKSDNNAAKLLCDKYPSGRSGCITAMNWRASTLGLTNTHYVDPSGLNVMNVSTARELVQIVLESSKYLEIVKASNIAHGKIKKKKQYFSFNNTNPLVATTDFIISKTGYIHASGGCIVIMLDTQIGRRIVVLLNSKNTHTRISEVNQLATRF